MDLKKLTEIELIQLKAKIQNEQVKRSMQSKKCLYCFKITTFDKQWFKDPMKCLETFKNELRFLDKSDMSELQLCSNYSMKMYCRWISATEYDAIDEFGRD